VLGYIANDSRRFHVFVANRVATIQQHSRTEQWNHVKGSDNPADEASRGLTVEELLTESNRYFILCNSMISIDFTLLCRRVHMQLLTHMLHLLAAAILRFERRLAVNYSDGD
jgi:hypothetical protein